MHVSFKAIGRNIRAARMELGITQEDAANASKFPSFISADWSVANVRPLLKCWRRSPAYSGFRLHRCSTAVSSARGLSSAPAPGQNRSGQRIASIANGCSPKAQRLMLELCRDVALSDKQSDYEEVQAE